ncbi:MAG: redoxin domain-containing protein [Maioricimonas sp. JB049]
MHLPRLLLLTVAASICAASAAVAETTSTPIGKLIRPFELQDGLGASHSLEEWSDAPAIVVVFFGTECPLAKLYGPRLAALAGKYAGQRVQFVGIDANRQDSLIDIARYGRAHGIGFPLLKDAGNVVADQFGAVRTPEAFVLDQNRIVRYWGRIDDQYGVGYARADVQRQDLAVALDEVLAGIEVSRPVTRPVGCIIGRVRRPKPDAEVTYTRDVAPILNRHCVSCHREGEIGPFAMTSYEEIAGWAETIVETVENGRMPPWHASPAHGDFLNDARLSEEEKQTLAAWAKAGAPQGDPADLPEPPQFVDGWQIPEPDMVIPMPASFKVPAKGVVPYRYFTVDPGFEEDKWVVAAEARPGNRAVVHHLILFFQPPGTDRFQGEDALFNSIASFAPGLPASTFPASRGLARRIPAGSKLIFQVHYTPVGTEQVDLSSAGLVFADPKDVKQEVKVDCALNFRFRIPPEAGNHRVQAEYRVQGPDRMLYAITPHMHLRGKSFHVTAVYPDEREEVLLDVPRYDFNWQNTYILAEPKLLPDGTVLRCVAHFDNSSGNVANPDPSATVGWGDQTWEEMMIGSFTMTIADQDLSMGRPQVRATGKNRFEATFRYRPEEPVESVHLAGEFNDWSMEATPFAGPDDDGWYRAKMLLAPGKYEYKFVVNGSEWKNDPGNPEFAGYYFNNVLWVRE